MSVLFIYRYHFCVCVLLCSESIPRGFICAGQAAADQIRDTVPSQVWGPINECLALPRSVGCEHADLTGRDLADRDVALAMHTARSLVLNPTADFINNQKRLRVARAS